MLILNPVIERQKILKSIGTLKMTLMIIEVYFYLVPKVLVHRCSRIVSKSTLEHYFNNVNRFSAKKGLHCVIFQTIFFSKYVLFAEKRDLHNNFLISQVYIFFAVVAVIFLFSFFFFLRWSVKETSFLRNSVCAQVLSNIWKFSLEITQKKISTQFFYKRSINN